MTTDLMLTVRREEAVLVRVLGVVVRRGFEPVRVQAETASDGITLHIELTIEGDRSVEALTRHLAKLNEVQRVKTTSPVAGR